MSETVSRLMQNSCANWQTVEARLCPAMRTSMCHFAVVNGLALWSEVSVLRGPLRGERMILSSSCP